MNVLCWFYLPHMVKIIRSSRSKERAICLLIPILYLCRLIQKNATFYYPIISNMSFVSLKSEHCAKYHMQRHKKRVKTIARGRKVSHLKEINRKGPMIHASWIYWRNIIWMEVKRGQVLQRGHSKNLEQFNASRRLRLEYQQLKNHHKYYRSCYHILDRLSQHTEFV